MTNTISFHPTELGYVLSYLKVNALIGWGPGPFTPPPAGADAYYAAGLDRLKRAQRLVAGNQPGRYRFSDQISRIAATLSEPEIVLVTNRKEKAGARILTHHLAGAHIVELSLGKDGNFQVVEYESLAAAAAAAAAFVGATAEPVANSVRIEADQKAFAHVKELAKDSAEKPAIAALVKLGATELAARSAVSALKHPAASGVVSVMYCVGNAVQDADTYAVLTNDGGESWVVLPLGSSKGQVVLERTSVSALTAGIVVAVAARMAVPG
jgi:hypothetical protein